MEHDINAEAQRNQYDSQSNGQHELPFIVFQGHGGGDGACEAFGISPQHHTDSNFGNDPAESGNDGCNDSEASLPEYDHGCLPIIGSQRHGRFSISLVDLTDGGNGKSCNDRKDQYGLPDDYRLLSVEEIKNPEDGAPGDERIHKKPDRDRRERQHGIQAGYQQPFTPERFEAD